MKGTIIWLDLKLGNSLSFSLSLAPEVTFSSTLLDVLHSLLELPTVSAHKSHGSRPGLDRATLVRPDTVGHLVRLDRLAAVGLDVVVPVLLLPAVLVTWLLSRPSP